jgi:hypothetical protein
MKALGLDVKARTVQYGPGPLLDASAKAGELICRESRIPASARYAYTFRPEHESASAEASSRAEDSLGATGKVLYGIAGLLPGDGIHEAMDKIEARINDLRSSLGGPDDDKARSNIESLVEARFHLLQAYDAMRSTRYSIGEIIKHMGLDTD